jgi:hypothetical protein
LISSAERSTTLHTVSTVSQISINMASEIPDLAALPTAQSITLLLKNHKSTTLLSVQPTSTLDDIKVLLIAALKSRNTPGIPESPVHIELGVLADRWDASKGWVDLLLRAQDLATGKTAKKAVGGKKGVFNNSVEGAGLVDGSWVAWRVRTSGAKDGEIVTDEDGDAVVVDIEEVEVSWDVVIPRYEDDEEV